MKEQIIEVVANAKKGEKERSIKVPLMVPESIKEAEEIFGEKVVFDTFNAQLIIKFQAFVRGQLAAEDNETGLVKNSEEEVTAAAAAWKLTGGNRSKLSTKDKLAKLFSGMSKEEVEAALADLDVEELVASQVEEGEDEDEGINEPEDFE